MGSLMNSSSGTKRKVEHVGATISRGIAPIHQARAGGKSEAGSEARRQAVGLGLETLDLA